MTKDTFLGELKDALAGLPEESVEDTLDFYREMIDDGLEEGLSEEEAVSSVGSVEEIAAQVMGHTPLTKIITERIKPKRRPEAWVILLLILGFPIWFSLLVSAAAVIFSLYVSLWSVVVSLWAVFGALVGSAFGGIIGGLFFTFTGNRLTGMVCVAGGLVCAGLSIFLFYGCKAATKGTVLLGKKTVQWIKSLFARKEDRQ